MTVEVDETDWLRVPVFGSITGRFPAKVRPSAYAIISDGSGRVATVRTPLGYFLIGGGQDAGEPPSTAVVREADEECALIVRVGSWRAVAVEHACSISEQLEFEKRCTFCDALVVGRTDHDPERDHELVWLQNGAALEQLASPSHRWALGQWIAEGSSAR